MRQTFPDNMDDQKINFNHITIYKCMKNLNHYWGKNYNALKFDLKMKLTALLLFVALFQIQASTYSQNTKISLNLKNVSVGEVLDEIQLLTEFKFFIDTKLIDTERIVSVNVRKERVSKILNKVFTGTNVAYKVLDKQIIFKLDESISGAIQKAQVKGIVTDGDGNPMPGVNVRIEGTSVGTQTDFDGNYVLKASKGDVIIFTYIGMKTVNVTVGESASVNVVLEEETNSLNEVVVTALGIKRSTKRLGYAMNEVKGEEIAVTNTINPVLALQGKTAGVSIGSSDGGLFGNAKIQIRGISTMNSTNNQPIFVIDGVILENSISNASADWSASADDYGNILKNLNPDDYKSVSVLKGAAATALYGSRGINGVILITSKDGAGAQGLGVSVKQTTGFDYVYDQPGIQYEFGDGALPGYTSYGEKDADDKFYRFSTNQFYTNADGIATKRDHPWGGFGYGPKFDGRPIIGFDGELEKYNPSTNNMKDAYGLGVNSNTSLALRGGNDKGTFYLSDSYNDRTGNLPNNSFKRNSLSFNGTYKLAEWLKARASISYTTSTSKNPRNDVSQRFFDGTWGNWYDTKKYKQRKYWQAPHGGLPSNNYGDSYTGIASAGYWFASNMNDSSREEEVIRPIVNLTANLTDWLTVSVEGSINKYNTKYEQKNLGSGFANEGGYYELKHTNDESKTGKVTLNINKDINEDLTANLLIGGETWSQEKSNTRVRTDGGLIVPGRFYMGNSKKNLLSSAGISGTKKISSLYFMGSFGYKDQLFVDITGRNDWSSALVYTDGTGNNSYFYPSVSTSWLVNETFELPNWVTFGKIRASWAQVGSDTNPYEINKGYGDGKYELAGDKFVYLNAVNTKNVSRDIKPERKNSIEIGADIRFLNNRLGLDIAYYDETIDNQIGDVRTDIVSGFKTILTNVGSLTNSGLEISLTGKPIKTENFVWESTFNYSKGKTEINNLHKDYGAYKVIGGSASYGNFRVGSVAFEGGEYGVLMSDTTVKKWQSTDTDGNAIADPRNGMKVLTWSDSRRGAFHKRSNVVEEIGKIQPDFEGSWVNSFRYKNFSMSVMLDARYGGHIASYSSKYGTANGYLETSLKNRDVAHGGIEWNSQYADTQGRTYSDGMIPDGIFEEGQTVTAINGATVDVGGMTYQEAYDAGHIEPTHAGFNHYFSNSWSRGTVNDSWFKEVKYIAIRNITVGYNLPKSVSKHIGANNLNISLNARNVGYLYNSLPNNINPESFRGTSSNESYYERSFSPYTANYSMTIAIDF